VDGEIADGKLKAKNVVSNALTVLLPAYIHLLVKKALIFVTVCIQKSTTMDHNTKCYNALFTCR
jgi:hypothetical protein